MAPGESPTEFVLVAMTPCIDPLIAARCRPPIAAEEDLGSEKTIFSNNIPSWHDPSCSG
jgi:hypothetical protein